MRTSQASMPHILGPSGDALGGAGLPCYASMQQDTDQGLQLRNNENKAWCPVMACIAGGSHACMCRLRCSDCRRNAHILAK